MDRDGVDAELVNGPYEQISQIKNPELRAACVRAVNDWARELYEESGGRFIMLLPLPCMTPEEATAELLRVAEFGLPTGVIFDWVFAPEPVMHQMWEPVWAAAAETGMPVNLHAYPSGGSRQIGVGVAGARAAQPVADAGRQFPDGAMAELMSAVVFSGICDRHPGHPLCARRGRGRLGPVHVLALRPRIRFRRAGNRVFKPDIPLRGMPSEFVKAQVFFTFEVEEEGGFRRVPEVGLREFPVGQRLPRPRQPVAAFEGDGPCAGRERRSARRRSTSWSSTIAVSLYKIPVTAAATARRRILTKASLRAAGPPAVRF